MTNVSHTKGPWHLLPFNLSDETIHVRSNNPSLPICTVNLKDMCEANARLIAAAPELLQSAVFLLRELDALGDLLGNSDQAGRVRMFKSVMRDSIEKATTLAA